MMNQLPKRSHYKINEVCGATGVKPYVLRFWESEFEDISPEVDDLTGQKLYAKTDLDTVFKIKEMLFEQKMSIDEAKFSLRREKENLVEEIITDEEPQEPLLEAQPEKHVQPEEQIQEVKQEQKVEQEQKVQQESTEVLILNAPIQEIVTEEKAKNDVDMELILSAKAKLNELIKMSHTML
jgi:DNA-binding transcriptional MerR regulator